MPPSAQMRFAVAGLISAMLCGVAGLCEDPAHSSIEPIAPAVVNDDRILGVIPNYQAVSDPHLPYIPLTKKQKWDLAFKETIDPFNVASAAVGAAMSQAGNQTPKYGMGTAAYGMRLGAAIGDSATQNLFSAGALATLLHQDPRYFRRGPEYSILNRVAYSISRIVVTRNDNGTSGFNSSGVFGMMLGIGASNLYYPAPSVKGSVMAGRLTTSITGGITGNLLSEFWPDVERLEKKMFRRKK